MTAEKVQVNWSRRWIGTVEVTPTASDIHVSIEGRPLVVIDPNDRQSVIQLCNTAAFIHASRAGLAGSPMVPTIEDYQAALRAMATVHSAGAK